MSFRVFAAGSIGFHFAKDNNPDMEIFEAAVVASALVEGSDPSGKIVEHVGAGAAAAVAVGQGVADALLHPVSDHAVYHEALAAHATAEFLHCLDDTVTLLAACSGANDGCISVYSCQSHLLWPDTVGFASYCFSPGDYAGREFFQAIKSSLEKTDMNNYGVLRILSIVLAKYYEHIGESGTPWINIQLFK